MILLLAALLTGAFAKALHFAEPADHYINIPETNQTAIFGVIRERLKNGQSAHRYIMDVKIVGQRRSAGKLLISVRDASSPLPPGTPVAFHGSLLRIRPPLNPAQFDYSAYLRNQSIAAQSYVYHSALICGKPTHGPRYFFVRIRSRISIQLHQAGMSPEGLRIASALILGQRQELDRGIQRDYERAGAVHILSVSGLHVGFVMLALNFILKPLPRNAKGRTVRFCAHLAGLWTFAFLTGMSASVVRSAAMFSMFAAGESLHRPANRFHTLMVSAVLILLVNPALLRDVGFQLSYSAVLSILWLSPVIEGALEPRGAVLRYLWSVAAVSLAAQLGTLPLSLLYFHQFPGLFLVTNLIVIPMVTFIMLFGFVAMAIATVFPVPKLLITILDLAIRWMNLAIAKVASVDALAINEIPFTVPMSIATALIIIFFGRWLIKRTSIAFIPVLVALSVLQAIILLKKKEAVTSSEMVVFHDHKKMIIAFRHGDRVRINEASDYHLKPYRIANFVNKSQEVQQKKLFWFDGLRVMIIDSTTSLADINPDLVVISGSPKINLERALEIWKPKMVVADGTNYKSYVRRWEKTCQKRKIPFHATAEKGFYSVKKGIISR